MGSVPEDSASDNDNERPVREKLKKASLGAFSRSGSGSLEQDNSSHVETAETLVPETQGAAATLVDKTEAEGNGSAIESQPRRSAAPDFPQNGEGQATAQAAESVTNAPVDGEGSKPAPEAEADKPPLAVKAAGSTPHPTSITESVPQTSSIQRHASITSSGVQSSLDEVERAEEGSSPRDASMEDVKNGLKIPKKKRSRDQFNEDLDRGEPLSGTSEEARRVSEDAERPSVAPNRASRTIRDEPEKKRHRDASQEAPSEQKETTASIPPTSGFSNTSVTSPFATLSGSKSPGWKSPDPTTSSSDATKDKPQTSSSAFAASGFGALAGSATSPFGAIGGSSTASGGSQFSGFGGFGDGSSSKSTGFGGLGSGGGSAFGSGASGFGSLGGGTKSVFGGTGSGLSGFASSGGGGIIGLSDKPPKAFGAPEGDQEDEDGEDDDGEDDGDEDDEEKGRQESEDRRSHEVETGEEGEETVFSAQAKLYHLVRGNTPAESGWKERGAGLLKINVTVPPDEDGVESTQAESEEDAEEKAAPAAAPQSARLLMRASGVYRVVLNSPVYKGMNLRTPDGDAPSATKPSKLLMFTVIEEEKPVMMQMKFRDPSSSLEVYRKVSELEEHL